MEAVSDAYRTNGLLQFFSFEGRVRRMTFWINILICGVASFVVDLMFVDLQFSMFLMEARYVVSSPLIYYPITILILLRVLSITVRRWQDQDKSGALAITAFLPVLSTLFPNFVFYTGVGNVLLILGIVVLLVAGGFLGFVPGDDDQNSFGPPPEEGQWF